MRCYPAIIVLALATPAFADAPPPPPAPPPIQAPQRQPTDQVRCQRELLTWVVAYLDDPDNAASRKNFVSKTLAIANCANGDAVAPAGRPIPEPPVPPAAMPPAQTNATAPPDAPKKE